HGRELAAAHAEGDPAQRVDCGLALAVAARDVHRLDDGAVCMLGCGRGCGHGLAHRPTLAVPLPVMLPRFWVASTKRCKYAGSPSISRYVSDRGRGSAPRDRGPEARRTSLGAALPTAADQERRDDGGAGGNQDVT